MKCLARRLTALEGGHGRGPFPHLSDHDLEARVADLKAEIENYGIEFPADWEQRTWSGRAGWLQQSLEVDQPLEATK